jgi:uncharacterized LabA/DUF88 family protein
MLPKALIYIDGQATHAATKHLELNIDYKRLLAYFRHDYSVPRAVYATLVQAADVEFNSLRPLLDFLQYNGWQTLTRERIPYTDANGASRYRGSIDTALALDAYEFCSVVRPETLFLFSGDSDLLPLIWPVQRLGVRVHLVSTVRGTDKFCDTAMRRHADDFTDLTTLAPHIESLRRREPLPPPEPEPEAISEPFDPRELVDTTPKPLVVERRKTIRRGAGH